MPRAFRASAVLACVTVVLGALSASPAAAAAGTGALKPLSASAPVATVVPGVAQAPASSTAGSTAGSRTSTTASAAAQRRLRQQRAAAKDVVARINATRRAHGRTPLKVAADLSSYATRHSSRMAAPGRLAHSKGLTGLRCWSRIGENVAYAASPAAAHVALLGSPSHRANILSPRFTEVGVGVVRRDGVVWVTQVFRTPARGRC